MKTIKVFCTILSVVLIFTRCSMSDNASNEIQLTTENASQYLTFELHGYPSDYNASWDSYSELTVNGTITGVPGYSYNNVVITVAVGFKYHGDDYADHNHTIEASSTLNIGGSGTVSASEYIGGHMSLVESTGYTITSVTGTVTKN